MRGTEAPQGRVGDTMESAVGYFYRLGQRSGAALVLRYDGALQAVTRDHAQDAADAVLEERIDVAEAANVEAGRIFELGAVEGDPRDAGIDLTEAYWRGVQNGAGASYDRITAPGYEVRSYDALPTEAGGDGGWWSRLKRALRH